jgi:hypothetical protein
MTNSVRLLAELSVAAVLDGELVAVPCAVRRRKTPS